MFVSDLFRPDLFRAPRTPQKDKNLVSNAIVVRRRICCSIGSGRYPSDHNANNEIFFPSVEEGFRSASAAPCLPHPAAPVSCPHRSPVERARWVSPRRSGFRVTDTDDEGRRSAEKLFTEVQNVSRIWCLGHRPSCRDFKLWNLQFSEKTSAPDARIRTG